jgi:hypothetical protein
MIFDDERRVIGDPCSWCVTTPDGADRPTADGGCG